MIAFHTGEGPAGPFFLKCLHQNFCPNKSLPLSPPAAVHIVAHLFNFEYFMDAQLDRNSSLLPFVLSQVGSGDNASFLNPIRSNETVSSCRLTISSFLPPKLVQICEIPRIL